MWDGSSREDNQSIRLWDVKGEISTLPFAGQQGELDNFTADLLRLREQQELAAAFDSVLPKPPDLGHLRKVVADALIQS